MVFCEECMNYKTDPIKAVCCCATGNIALILRYDGMKKKLLRPPWDINKNNDCGMFERKTGY